MSELKPCPFCGGEAITIQEHGWWVVCTDCSAEVGFEGMTDTSGCYGSYQTEAEAIAAWNTRYDQQLDAIPATEENMARYGWVRERTCKQKRLFNLIRRECDGEWYEWHGEELPNYCPNCGAKVVTE